jgi:hypothetical protein
MALADDIEVAGQVLADQIEQIADQALADVIAGADPHNRDVPKVEGLGPDLSAVWEQIGPLVTLGVRNAAMIGGAQMRAEIDTALATPPSVTSGSAVTLGVMTGLGLGYRLGKAMGR